MKHSPGSARATLFSLGALAALAQLVLFREVMFLADGTELAASIIISSWLLAGAAGSYVASRRPHAFPPGMLMAACAIILPAQIMLLRLCRGALAGSTGQTPHIFLFMALCALLTSGVPVLLGAIFPAAASRLGTSGAARAYIAESAGFVTGSMLTLVILGIENEYLTVAFVSILFLLSGILILDAGKAILLLCAIPLLLAVSGLWGRAERASVAYAFRIPEVSHFASTPYGRAFSAIHKGKSHIYSNGLAQIPLANANETAELAISLLDDVQIIKILVICEDPEGYLRTFNTFPRINARILVPDKGMLKFRKKVNSYPESDNVTIVGKEPLHSLRHDRISFDVILIDMGAPLTVQNNRLFTLEFFKLARSRLSKNGFIALQLPYSPGHISKSLQALNGSIWHTLGLVFEKKRVAITQQSANILFFGSNMLKFTEIRPVQLPDREAAREKLNLYSPVDFEGSFFSQRTVQAGIMLDSRKWQTNTVSSPACYQHAISYSHQGAGSPEILEILWQVKMWHWLCLVVAMGVILTALAAAGRLPGSYPAVFGGGFCSMISQVIIIYVFQSSQGILYSHLGLLVGSFMIGAFIGSTRMRKYHSPILAFSLLSALSAYTVALPSLLGSFAAEGHFLVRYAAFPAAGILSGFLTGAIFPACSNLLPDTLGGRAYTLDLAGASLGALLGGLFLIPSLGLQMTALTSSLAGVFLALPLLPDIITRVTNHARAS